MQTNQIQVRAPKGNSNQDDNELICPLTGKNGCPSDPNEIRKCPSC